MPKLASALKGITRRICGFGGFALLSVGLIGAGIWTLLGILTSVPTAGPQAFLREWVLLQGPPLLALGFFLSLLSQSRRLSELSAELGCPPESVRLGTRARRTLILCVTLVGTGSLIALGFPARELALIFMWLTCLLICLMASFATSHASDVLLLASKLPNCAERLHLYSPADTPGIRKLAEYIAFFGLIVTIGYCFAFVGTVSGNWTNRSSLVQLVQYFWPMLYVPLCLATLLYPHIAIYRLIRREKDRTISGLQVRMVALASAEDSLSNEEIDRLNALADLIQKIENTPNYPRNLSLVGSLALTLLANLGSLLVPKEALAAALRSAIGL